MKSLYTVEEAAELIQTGKTLLLAGDESLLGNLPRGNWIGGTIPYFMSAEGGVTTSQFIHMDVLHELNTLVSIKTYSPDQLSRIPDDYPENGVSFIIVPCFSQAGGVFAKDIMSFDGIFNSPLVGWVAGTRLEEIGSGKVAKVYNGLTGEVMDNSAVIMHTSLPADAYATIHIVNIFEPREDAEIITFSQDGNVIEECLVNGELTNLADYLVLKNSGPTQPLIGDCMGAKLNVSIQAVDNDKKIVSLAAPVFKGLEYRLSAIVEDYAGAFTKELDRLNAEQVDAETGFACNCVFNYMFGGLEGKKTGGMTGPMTFGEIAYMLLNQTMVYCTYHKKS